MREGSEVLEIFTSERCRKRKSLPELRETRKKAIAGCERIHTHHDTFCDIFF